MKDLTHMVKCMGGRCLLIKSKKSTGGRKPQQLSKNKKKTKSVKLYHITIENHQN